MFKYEGLRTGRWSMGNAIQTLPRGASPLLEAPFIVVSSSFPGYDCFAADIFRDEDVIYDGRHKAKVISFDPNKDEVEIEFVEKDLIPPTMKVPVRAVSYAYGGQLVNKKVRCPKCAVPWKETPGFRFSFFDCPQCGMKREDA